MGEGHVTRYTRRRGRGCRGGFTHRLFIVVKLIVGTTPSVEVRNRPAGRGDPHPQRPDLHYALRPDGAVARAVGGHHQERLCAANRPSHLGPAARALVLGKSGADPRTESGSRRASARKAGPRRRPQTADRDFQPLPADAGAIRLSAPALAIEAMRKASAYFVTQGRNEVTLDLFR
jgi:hypothetical protein